MRLVRIALALTGVVGLAGCASPTGGGAAAPAAVAPATVAATAAAGVAPRPAAPSHPAARTVAPRTAAPRPAAPRPAPLLVEQMADTRGAGQVVTVTTGPGAGPVLQAFERVAGRWRRVFGPVPAVIGAQGFSTRVSEATTATPIGVFTLTEAFGTAPDPGTRLPYRRSQYGDVWVDQPSAPTYNTRQTGDADFGRGSGERLWQETTAYEYAVVIDYNRRPVRAGAGSAFFLHVTIPVPSQGCVTVRRDRLLWLLRWLDPARHPVLALGPEATVRTL